MSPAQPPITQVTTTVPVPPGVGPSSTLKVSSVSRVALKVVGAVAPPVVSVVIAMLPVTVPAQAVCAWKVKLTEVLGRPSLLGAGSTLTKSQLCASDSPLQAIASRPRRSSTTPFKNRPVSVCAVRRRVAASLQKSIAFPLECGYNPDSSIAADAPLQEPRRGSHRFLWSHAHDRARTMSGSFPSFR